jgi:hypothetical protein
MRLLKRPRNFLVRWRLALLGGLSLAILAQANGRQIEWLVVLNPHVQFGMLAVGIVGVVVGLGRRPGLRAPSDARQPGAWRVWLLLLAIVIFALGIRLWRGGEAIRVLVDEMNFVEGVTTFWNPNEHIGILRPMTTISPFTWLYPYCQMNLVGVLGRDLASLRAASAIIGALNVAALYLLAATVFDRPIGLLAAALLATFPPHLHYSRIALLSITDPLMGTLAFAFVARGLKHGRRLDFALGGAFLGLTQYFFEGGRLLFIPLVIAWGVLAWALNRRQSRQMSRSVAAKGLWIFALVAVIVAAPVYYALSGSSTTLVGRMDASGLNPDYWRRLLAWPPKTEAIQEFATQHIIPSFGAYLLTPDTTRYYGGETPLALPILAPAFLLGLYWLLRRLRQPGMLLLGLWLLLTALGNCLLVTSGASTRYVVVFPALALVMALGICSTLRWFFLERPFPVETAQRVAPAQVMAQTRVIATSLLVIIALGCSIVQVTYYFGIHLPRFDAGFRTTRPHRDLEDVVYRARGFPFNTQIHIVSRVLFDPGYARRFMRLYRDELLVKGYVGAAFNDEVIAGLPREVDHAFFVEPDDIRTLSLLQVHFRLDGPYFSPYNVEPERQFVLFYVARDTGAEQITDARIKTANPRRLAVASV